MEDTYLALTATAEGLLNDWPDLRTQLASIYSDNVNALPFVPADWLSGALARLHEDSGSVWLPTPHPTNPPAWLQDSAAQAAWKAVFDKLESAVGQYAAGQQAAGAAELSSLQHSATFWNAVYTADRFIADLPHNTLVAAGSVADSIGSGILSSTVGKIGTVLLIAALLGAAYVLFPAAKKLAVGKVAALG